MSIGAGGLVANRYRLGGPLGRGGMGRVYQAHDQVLDRDVAVKLLDEGGCAHATVSQLCADEALVAGRLSHPGVASIFDSGVHEGCAFVVMELVEGRPLDQIIRDGPRPSPVEAAGIVSRIADALDYAHQQGVVHCDVKPQNIILTPEGQPKLVDFGIARVMTTTRSLAPGELLGSAPYVSPEQVRGGRVDGRVDIYALGAVLYELLTGRPPFQGPTMAAIVAQHLVATAPQPRSLNPNISLDLQRVVLIALARDPSKRYATAGAFRDALQRLVHGERVAAQARTVRVEPMGPRPTVIRSRPRSRFFPAVRRPMGKTALAAIAVVVLLAGTVLLVSLLQGAPQVAQGAPNGQWLKNHRLTEMWSGPSDQPGVISFGKTSSQFCVFQQRDQRGDRLYVFNPYSENYFWIDADAVGPVVLPETRSSARKPPGHNCADAIFVTPER